MAGILAVARPDGSASRRRAERLLRTLDYRGHDGSDLAVSGGVALGHQHFATTPEAEGERQPVELDGVRLVVDGRVDNRAAVVEALPDASPDSSDAELLARAYREWETDFLDRVIGVFALALHDEAAERLLWARDRTGVRHVFYAPTPDGVAVASDAATLLEHPAVGTEPNDALVAGYLTGDVGPTSETFFADVRRLEAGTYAVHDGNGIDVHRYWQPTDGDPVADDAPLPEQLRRLFEQAIAARLRTRSTPAVMMSGGLDSTAVASTIAARLDHPTVPAYSMVFDGIDDPRLVEDERERVREVGRVHDVPVTELESGDHWPLSRMEPYRRRLPEAPCVDALQPAVSNLLDAVRDDGHGVVLTGHGGNCFDGSRLAYADLFARRRFVRLARELRRDPLPTKRLLLWWTVAPNHPRLARRIASSDGDETGPAWLGPRLRDVRKPGGDIPEFDSFHRRRAYAGAFNARRELKLHSLRQSALARGLDVRMPYLDARLVAFAFSVPPETLFRDGSIKWLFREAMTGVLPERVRAIPEGRHFDAFLRRGLCDREVETVRDLVTDGRLVARGYADADGLSRTVARADRGQCSPLEVWRLVSTELWLRALA